MVKLQKMKLEKQLIHKNNKAVGYDHLPSELYKFYIDWWAPLITTLINKQNRLMMPGSWEIGIIILIHKK